MSTPLVPSILLYTLRLNTALSYSALVGLGSDVLDRSFEWFSYSHCWIAHPRLSVLAVHLALSTEAGLQVFQLINFGFAVFQDVQMQRH